MVDRKKYTTYAKRKSHKGRIVTVTRRPDHIGCAKHCGTCGECMPDAWWELRYSAWLANNTRVPIMPLSSILLENYASLFGDKYVWR